MDEISEKTFQSKVEAFLKERKLWYLKVWGNGVQRSGVPDLLICCNGQFIGCELKKEDGRASALQIHELERIKSNGGIAMVLKPNGFENFKAFIRRLEEEKIEVQTKYEIFA